MHAVRTGSLYKFYMVVEQKYGTGGGTQRLHARGCGDDICRGGVFHPQLHPPAPAGESSPHLAFDFFGAIALGYKLKPEFLAVYRLPCRPEKRNASEAQGLELGESRRVYAAEGIDFSVYQAFACSLAQFFCRESTAVAGL